MRKQLGETPLHEAADKGDAESIRVLIEAGADVHAKDNRGHTPLHKAADKGDAESIRVLIEAGADIHAKDNEDRTPLHEAARKGDTESIRVLTEADADVHAKDNEDRTPLHVAPRKVDAESIHVLTEVTYDLAPPSSDMPELEKAELRNRQPKNLYIITSRIHWKKESSALGDCNLSDLEPVVAAAIQALADHKDIRETAAKWGIESIRLAIALVAAWAMEHNADRGQGTERHADRVRRHLLKGVNMDTFGAYFRQFDPGGK